MGPAAAFVHDGIGAGGKRVGTGETKNNIWLHRYATVVACATFLLIIAGALVTSQDAGLSVPDWPLSFGRLMPPMVGNIFYEHGHRMVATFVGLLTTLLAIWLWRSEPRRWVRRLGLAALLAVVLQGALGGITVLFFLPLPISVSHACLGQLFFCLTVSLALFTSPKWEQEAPPIAGSLHPPLPYLCVATTVAIFLQLVLGAAFRHSSRPDASGFGVGIMPHLVGAAVVTIGVGLTAGTVMRRHAGQLDLLHPAMVLGGLLVFQLVLGAGAYFTKMDTREAPQPMLSMVALSVAHVAFGALTLASSLVLTLRCYRRWVPARADRLLAAMPQKVTP